MNLDGGDDLVVPTYIDVFSGGGGLSIGMENAGFRCLLAIDIEELAVTNYNHNLRDKVAVEYNIRELNKNKIIELINEKNPNLKKINVNAVVGGPICKGFSSDGNRDVMDERNSLVDEFFRIVDEMKPDYFLMENVKGILSMYRPDGKKLVTEWIEETVNKMGYNLKYKLLYSHHYGDPQKRPRVFFVGWKEGVVAPKNFLQHQHIARTWMF